jgi:hypothetical protein
MATGVCLLAPTTKYTNIPERCEQFFGVFNPAASHLLARMLSIGADIGRGSTGRNAKGLCNRTGMRNDVNISTDLAWHRGLAHST